jgi:hypothetical protein
MEINYKKMNLKFTIFALFVFAFCAAQTLTAQKKQAVDLNNDLIANDLNGTIKSVSFYTQDMSDPKMDLGFADKIWVFNPKGYLDIIHTLDYRGMIIGDEVFSYDVQNRIVRQQEQTVRNSKFPNQNVFKTYRKDSLCISTRYEYEDSTLWYRESNHYNDKKQLVFQYGISPKLDTFERRAFVYDADGSLGEESYFLQNKLLEKFLYTYNERKELTEKHRYEYDGTLGGRETYNYNADGKQVSFTNFDARGRKSQFDTLFYDDQKRQTEQLNYEFNTETGDSALLFRTTYGYDDFRRTIVKTRTDASGVLVDKVISYFNVNQEVILRESIAANGEQLWRNKYEAVDTTTMQTIAKRHSTNVVEVDKTTVFGANSQKTQIWTFSRNASIQPSRVETFSYNDKNLLSMTSVELLKNVTNPDSLAQAERALLENIAFSYIENTNLLQQKEVKSVRQPPIYAPNLPADTQQLVYHFQYLPKKNTLAKMQILAANGDTLEAISYTYKGKLLVSALRYSYENNKILPQAALTTYDKHGRELTVHIVEGNKKALRQKNVYQSKTKLLAQAFLYDADGKTITEKTRHEYTFDKKGNWTRHIINKNDRVSQVQQRIFVYYP